MQRILVVEDESPIAETLAVNLRAEGYRVTATGDGIRALELAAEERPDLIILDIMLPGMDGIEVCRALRKRSDVPIIMLTARAREVDKVVGLEVGADDYVTKPFGMMELIARVRAALRRRASAVERSEVIEADDLVIDLDSHTLTIGGSQIELRPREFGLLSVLVKNRGRALSREVLLQRVWGEDEYIDHSTVDVHIRRLREKIEVDPSKPTRVLTVRGAGYKYAS